MIEIAENKGVIYEFGKFVLDPQERVLSLEGKPIHLTDKVFETLLLLVQQNGRLLTKDEMMASIWDESFVEESNLAKNISRLRKILNTDGGQLIETLPRRGYRFLANVNEINGETSLLVHRQLRVKVSKTIENGKEPKALNYPALLDSPVKKPRLKITWIIGGFTVLLLTGIFFIYNFPISNKPAKSDGPTNLTNNLEDDDLPAWSPDGSKVAFTSNRDGMGEIYVMSSDGSGVTRLTFTSAREGAATWSPDGKKIAFDSERDGNTEIYIMDADGSKQSRLTFNPTSDVGPVSFSPDGKRIAFARNAAGGLAVFNYDIYTMNADGSDVKQLTTDPGYDAEPMWSPDGSRILFITDRLTNFEIFSIDPDGSGDMNVSNSPGHDGAIGYTPNGQQIFCRSDTPDKLLHNQIYLINLDGTHRRQITSFADKTFRVAYSPQAQKFAFTTKKDGNFEIYTIDAVVPPS